MPFEDEWRASVYGVKLNRTSKSVLLDCSFVPQSPPQRSSSGQSPSSTNESESFNLSRAQTAPNGPADMRSAIQYENEIRSLREQLKMADEEKETAVAAATKKLKDEIDTLKALHVCYSTLLSAQSEERISECERSLARARVARAILNE